MGFFELPQALRIERDYCSERVFHREEENERVAFLRGNEIICKCFLCRRLVALQRDRGAAWILAGA
jgi:hypothetical protein